MTLPPVLAVHDKNAAVDSGHQHFLPDSRDNIKRPPPPPRSHHVHFWVNKATNLLCGWEGKFSHSDSAFCGCSSSLSRFSLCPFSREEVAPLSDGEVWWTKFPYVPSTTDRKTCTGWWKRKGLPVPIPAFSAARQRGLAMHSQSADNPKLSPIYFAQPCTSGRPK